VDDDAETKKGIEMPAFLVSESVGTSGYHTEADELTMIMPVTRLSPAASPMMAKQVAVNQTLSKASKL
jgi:hypothetical protein